ncbi:MAG: 3-isopropylmalate dehydrogenase [Spirochaetaceae bacterium]|jgi:3-isopropylmalate dehydrogenase|nr:3-isopropylmalate dehydrogenase [Spirochaetaceae bacterium]
MRFKIALLGGDGIGPEVTAWAVRVLETIGTKRNHNFDFVPVKAGGAAIDEFGEPLPKQTLEAAKSCDALLLGAVGGPKWDSLPGHLRPERALLGLRAGLGVFANLRPAALLPQLKNACPLKDEVLALGSEDGKPAFDMLIVRELTGGIYFGEHGREGSGSEESAYDTERYSRSEIERVLRVAYKAAAGRRKKLCVVDKANVLESSRLWRETAQQISRDYPDIKTEYLYVDNCAMQLVRAPGQFDVIVTSNIFGDILSDEASVIAGSIGMLASASIGSGKGIFEPIHGSAPLIAGKNIANPLAAILSSAMLLKYSCALDAEANAVENAVYAVLDSGFRTSDIASRDGAAAGEKIVGTSEMGEAVLKALNNLL